MWQLCAVAKIVSSAQGSTDWVRQVSRWPRTAWETSCQTSKGSRCPKWVWQDFFYCIGISKEEGRNTGKSGGYLGGGEGRVISSMTGYNDQWWRWSFLDSCREGCTCVLWTEIEHTVEGSSGGVCSGPGCWLPACNWVKSPHHSYSSPYYIWPLC